MSTLKQFIQNKLKEFRRKQNEQRFHQCSVTSIRYSGLQLSYDWNSISLSSILSNSPITFIIPYEINFDDTNNVNDIIHRIERLTWTLGRISRSITPCDEPVFLTIGHDTIHGTIVVNKQKYNISFLFDPDDPKDVSTIEGTSPLQYKSPETNENSPIFLNVNQSDARLVLTRPADWSNLFITYSMDTDYWFHDFNISHFKQFLYEFERVRSIFTNVE